jgi:hypothetical protein
MRGNNAIDRNFLKHFLKGLHELGKSKKVEKPPPAGCTDEGLLKRAWTDSNDYITISHHNIAETKPLLQHAYRQIQSKIFPLDHGGEPLDRWLEFMEKPIEDVDYRIIIAGQNLRSSGGANDNAVIKAMVVSIYYRGSDTGLLAYIATDRQYRNEGLGQKLTKLQAQFLHAAAVENGKSLKGWFIECYDPSKTSDNYDDYSSRKLIDKYLSWGARQVPIDYSVPDTIDETVKARSYMLLSGPHPQTGKYADDRTILRYIYSIYSNLGIENPARDPDFIAMREKLLEGKKPPNAENRSYRPNSRLAGFASPPPL